MKEMGYVKKKEEEWVGRVWGELEGEAYGGIPAENLREMLVVIGVPPGRGRGKAGDGKGKRVVIDGQLRAVFDRNRLGEIYNDYLPLRVNRMLQPPQR